MRKAKITKPEELSKELGIKSIDELKNDPLAQVRLAGIAQHIESGLLSSIISTIPELAGELSKVIASMNDIGNSIEQSRRMRWEVIRDLAKNGTLTQENILEAMKIIAEIEDKEKIDFNKIYLSATRILSVGLIVIIAILAGGAAGKRENENG